MISTCSEPPARVVGCVLSDRCPTELARPSLRTFEGFPCPNSGPASHLQVIVLCEEGYPSSLAAAALQDFGIWGATAVIGGWAAWRTEPAGTQTPA